MGTITFDTLRFANRLKNAGVPANQAEAEAEALAEVLETNVKDLATKNDLDLVTARLEKSVSEAKAELIRWAVGVGILQTALIAALLLKLTPH